MSLDPITHGFRLRSDSQRAFDVYVNEIGAWWPPAYSANPQTLTTVTIEPRVGGRVYGTHSDLGDLNWGQVMVWSPGYHLAYSSTLAQSRQFPSEISVRFAAEDDGGCRVTFEHRGWNEGNAADRPRFSEWPVILGQYARHADGDGRA